MVSMSTYKTARQVANAVSRYRDKYEMTLSDLSKAAGVVPNTIMNIERRGRTTLPVLLKVLNALDLDLVIIERRTDEEE